MSVIEIFVSADEAVATVGRKLGLIPQKTPLAVRTAINKTAKEAKKQDERITKKMYTAKGDIHALKLEKATTGNLQAILRDNGANISIAHFSHYSGKRIGVSATINTSHGRRRIGKYGNKAFGWGNLVMVRKSNSRLPIEKMASISSPVMHGNDQTWGTIEDETHQKLYENIRKELERILGQ